MYLLLNTQCDTIGDRKGIQTLGQIPYILLWTICGALEGPQTVVSYCIKMCQVLLYKPCKLHAMYEPVKPVPRLTALKLSSPTNQHTAFYRPSCCRTTTIGTLKGKLSHSMDLLTPSLPGVSKPCLLPLKAPSYQAYLGGERLYGVHSLDTDIMAAVSSTVSPSCSPACSMTLHFKSLDVSRQLFI